MKKSIYLLFVSLCAPAEAVTYKTSQTFMITRPVFQNITAQQQVWDELVNGKIAPCDSSLQAYYIFQKSRCLKKSAGYFLLNCQPCISIKGDSTINPRVPACYQRDVRAEWLGLPAQFQDRLCLNPRQEQMGTILEFNQYLGSLFECELFKCWWIDLFVPIVKVKNSLKPRAATETLNSLNQKSWHFAKINPDGMCDEGVPEIRASLGTTLYAKNGFLVATYSGIIIPTIRKYNPRYLFTPALGINGHIGITSGLNLELPLVYCDDIDAHIFLNINNDFYFPHDQTRTFDLFGKPWSRYLQFRRKGEAATVPGVNLLTHTVEIHPYNFYEISTGISFGRCGFSAELAYSIWGHGDEHIELNKKCCEKKLSILRQFAIAGDTIIGPDHQPVYLSASRSSISTLINDPRDLFITIRKRDIDLRSGIARGGAAHKINGDISYSIRNNSHLVFLGIGGFYELPIGNTVLRNWGVWAKAGINF